MSAGGSDMFEDQWESWMTDRSAGDVEERT